MWLPHSPVNQTLALIAAFFLAAAPPSPTDPRTLRAPELEALVQELRPFDDYFVKHPPIELHVDEAIDTFHQLWALGRKGIKLAGKDRMLANDFQIIASRSRVATFAGITAQPYVRIARRDQAPSISPSDERRTVQMVATVVARGEEVQRAISRILTRFPLWTDDAAWGYRPVTYPASPRP